MKEDQLQEGGGRGLFTLKNILVLLLGFILGYIIKGQAVQNITMGYDDYKIITNKNLEEKINKLPQEKTVVKQGDKQSDNDNVAVPAEK